MFKTCKVSSPVSFSSIEEKTESRKKIFQSIDESSILLGLVGRINRHKGQHLLLNVFGQLKKEGIDNIYLLFLGSTIKTQTFFLDVLQNEIKKKQLENVVTIVDFQKEIWKYYDAMDIVLVPTIDPEPFGLVAVEGMLSKKPVIAANHGGLKEIVVHHKTGLLFEPNSALDLKKSILEIIQNQKLIELFGSEGEERAKNKFSLQEYVNNFKAFYNSF